MNELLNIQNVTVVGILLIACGYLVKSNDKSLKRFFDEYNDIKEERKVERKEWLKALNDNTEQLKNVAQRLHDIPDIQSKIINVEKRLDSIEKYKINGGM